MKRCVILQPSYFPWLGVFQLIRRADVYIHLDTVSFDQNGWRNRNRLRFGDAARWLTLPVSLPRGRLSTPLREVRIADPEWHTKHRAKIFESLRFAPHYEELERGLLPMLRPTQNLLEVTIPTLERVTQLCGLTTEFRLASSLGSVAGRTAQLVHLCRQVGATHYLSGPSARDYLDESEFADGGIAVEWMDYSILPYRQARATTFLPNLSVLDALANVGSAALPELIPH